MLFLGVTSGRLFDSVDISNSFIIISSCGGSRWQHIDNPATSTEAHCRCIAPYHLIITESCRQHMSFVQLLCQFLQLKPCSPEQKVNKSNQGLLVIKYTPPACVNGLTCHCDA